MKNLNTRIDHTLLKPEASIKDYLKLCREALKYNFASVCVPSSMVVYVKRFLDSKVVKRPMPITTVVGFPHGNCLLESKLSEITSSILYGASEIDAVINTSLIKSEKWREVEAEILAVRSASYETVLKYIVEVGNLTDNELYKIADLLIKHNVDFIKTCTGYGPRGVKYEDIDKIKKHVGKNIKIKASGGIKTKSQAVTLVELGADRLGTSKSIEIIS